MRSIDPIEKGMKPLDCLCHGRPGTGKTALVKYILQLVNEFTNGLSFYVNCWENKTLNLILDRLVEQACIILADTRYSAKLSRLKQRIRNKPCVIALDEVDKLDREDLNDIIYMLKGLGKVAVVCISNTRKYVLNLDPRTVSRVRLKSISFPPYSDEELLTILKQRAIDCGALLPNSYSRAILEKIADLSAGDARIAIQTLRNAAYNAERLNRSKISIEDVEKGYEEVRNIKRKYYLERLTTHHKLMVKIVKKNPGILSSNFYDVYKHEARRCKLNPKSSRTFSNYINKLINLGYLKVERAKVRGNVRSFVAC